MSSPLETCLGPSDISVEHRPDGVVDVWSPVPLAAYPRSMTDRLDHWAAAAPKRTFLAQRDAGGAWRKISYADFREQARRIGQSLLDRGLSAERPVAIVSPNGIEHALVGFGAMYAGIPYASISVAYATLATDFARLRGIIEALTPGLVYASDPAAMAKALAAAVPDGIEIVSGKPGGSGRSVTQLAELTASAAGPALDAAHAAVGPDTIAKILFTSGSTGVPKGVINTQRMLCSNQAMVATMLPVLAEPPLEIVDWLPWSHTFGANFCKGAVLMQGGTMYIDEGRPLPGAIDATVRNLREIAPTVYFNVPKGYEMLLGFLERDEALRRTFFSRLRAMLYAGAALPQHLADSFEAMARETAGRAIPMVTSIGSTETAPSALTVSPLACGPAVVGIPNPGVKMKLVPSGGKLEVRLKGPNVTPGYWRQPGLTAAAFDEDGYYRIGDAFRFVDREDPRKGFLFDGRIAEDFKLSSGTWVNVGAVRGRLVNALAPLARDCVIAGHDRDYAAALMVPDTAACAAAAGLPADKSVSEIARHPAMHEIISGRLRAFNESAAGSATQVRRLVIMEAMPSIDTGEMTDKGSLNQRRVLEVHHGLVEELFAVPPTERIIVAA